MNSKVSNRPASAQSQSTRLTREDWIDAAYAAVVEGGFSAVRVLTLAEAIGVTRGSFYWHFGSQAELVDALIDRWCAQEAKRMQDFVVIRPKDPVEALMGWVDALIHSAPGSDFPHMRFGLALRAFARRNEAAALRLEEIDKSRLQVLQIVFRDLTPDPVRARKFAIAYYLALGGAAQLLGTDSTNPTVRAEVRTVIADILVHAARQD
jgi:AcrR family transcriptional regulator